MKRKLFVCLVLIAAMLLCAAVAFADNVPAGSVIPYGNLDNITEVDGNDVTEYKVTKEPTCTEKGIVLFDVTDPVAGTTIYVTCYIKELGHDWSSESGEENWGEIIKEPTCTEKGLAQDICLRCDAKREVYREINTTQHTFKDYYYTVAKAPTCTEVGYGIHLCIYCDHQKNADVKQWKQNNTTELVLDMIPHNWTDWRIDEYSTCGAYGEAHRGCAACGATQVLDATHTTVLDQGVEISIDEIIPKPNALWDEAKAPFAGKGWKNQTNYDNALVTFGEKVDYVETKNWLVDCYTREITLTCPYCKGAVHEPLVYTLDYPLTCAHTWVLSVDDSIAPTCTAPGLNYYICDQDTEGLKHSHNPSNMYEKDPAFYTEEVPPLGHDWLDWEVVEEFEKEGEIYQNLIRECERCHLTENQIIKKGDEPSPVPPTPLKDGLTLDEDGVWRYYEKGEFVKKTDIVEFEGGEFWVIDGLLAIKANGLTICPDGKAYFMSQGQILRVTQYAEYKGEWFKIVNGELDEKANGLYEYDGGTFVFAAGKLRKDVDGLWQNPKDGKWYFLSQGQVQGYTGVAEYKGEFFLLKNGTLDTAYEGTIEYDGHTFKVVEGQLYGPID